MAEHSYIFSFKEVLSFLKKLALFLAILVASDQLLGKALDYFLNHRVVYSGNFGVINRAINEKGDILILGDSKAKHNYIPNFISNNLGLSCFNLGADGMGIIYHYTLLTHILSNYKPRLVIFDINGKEFNRKFFDDANYYKLMPFIRHYESIIKIIEKKDRYIRLKLLSGLYPLNKKIHSLINDGLFAAKKDIRRGYQPLYGSYLKKEVMKDEDGQRIRGKIEELDILKSTFISFIELAKQREVPILFVNSPVWDFDDYYKNYPDFPKKMTEIIGLYGMKLIMIQKEQYPEFNDELYFRDQSHLNHNGAKLFSKIINNKLLQLKAEQYF